MRFWNQLLMAIQTMILLSGKMTGLPKPEDVDVAEAHSEVVRVVSIVRETVEDIEAPTVIVEDSVEAIEAATEATEVANEVESVV